MKKDIHPTYYPETEIKCACGQVFKIGSTKTNLKVEICSHCHPFYTGKKELVDIAGRAEKFKNRLAKAKDQKKSKDKNKKS